MIFAGIFSAAFAQTPTPTTSASTKTVGKSSPEKDFFKNILQDQKEIWTSPFRLNKHDANWLLPLGAATVGLIATDRKTAGALDNNQSRTNFSLDVSRFGSAYATGGTAIAFYAIGKITHNKRAQETGLLAGEALINSGLVVNRAQVSYPTPVPA